MSTLLAFARGCADCGRVLAAAKDPWPGAVLGGWLRGIPVGPSIRPYTQEKTEVMNMIPNHIFYILIAQLWKFCVIERLLLTSRPNFTSQILHLSSQKIHFLLSHHHAYFLFPKYQDWVWILSYTCSWVSHSRVWYETGRSNATPYWCTRNDPATSSIGRCHSRSRPKLSRPAFLKVTPLRIWFIFYDD